jgi:hypothetical protein
VKHDADVNWVIDKKRSSQQEVLNLRKNSNIVEEITTEHYNVDYPSLGIDLIHNELSSQLVSMVKR